jgi:hypothetical protein
MNRKICQHKIDLRLTMMFLFDRLDDFVLGLSYTTFSLVNEALPLAVNSLCFIDK